MGAALIKYPITYCSKMMHSAYCPNSWAYWGIITGQPTSATNVCMPSARPIIYAS